MELFIVLKTTCIHHNFSLIFLIIWVYDPECEEKGHVEVIQFHNLLYTQKTILQDMLLLC